MKTYVIKRGNKFVVQGTSLDGYGSLREARLYPSKKEAINDLDTDGEVVMKAEINVVGD